MGSESHSAPQHYQTEPADTHQGSARRARELTRTSSSGACAWLAHSAAPAPVSAFERESLSLERERGCWLPQGPLEVWGWGRGGAFAPLLDDSRLSLPLSLAPSLPHSQGTTLHCSCSRRRRVQPRAARQKSRREAQRSPSADRRQSTVGAQMTDPLSRCRAALVAHRCYNRAASAPATRDDGAVEYSPRLHSPSVMS
jgi:hypothetical protein